MLLVLPITGLPEIAPGSALGALIAAQAAIERGDVLVVTSKIVSKAEGRFVELATIEPSAEAIEIAGKALKDPRLVELAMRESSAVVRVAPNVFITRHRLGHVMANSGIDASNIGGSGESRVLLLPDDPDASAVRIAEAVEARTGIRPAVVISDSFGRPWRMGTVNVAIGLAGFPAVIDQRGQADRDGRVMQVTQIAIADAVACAAGLVMGEGAEGIPAAIVRGLVWDNQAPGHIPLLRPVDEDLFR
jgi:coenzyme F420-0:L-glutamate ligase/coenzyme F420-1:gamma-L-glutamate ligase